MENIEIPQQEKQGIFETANLKTIIPKTPEEKERVEKIKQKIIDIEKYRGLIHFTQLPNLNNVLLQGIKRGQENNISINAKWGFGGRLGGTDDHLAVYCTRTGTNSSFQAWKNIPFMQAGPLLILFDINQLNTIEDFDADDKKRMNLTDYLKSMESKQVKVITLLNHFGENRHLIDVTPEEIKIFDEEGISKKAIRGIIVSFNKKLKLEISKQKKIFLTPKQIAESASIQLTRLFYKKPDAHLVPLYDHLGNVLWPEKIAYQKVTEKYFQKNKTNTPSVLP